MELIKLSKKIVNLKNVSTIQKDTDRNKIIFNFVNSIDVFNKEIPDYTYEICETREELEEKFNKILEHPYVKDNFLMSDVTDEIINKNYITNITIDKRKNRIIFNLNFSITVRDEVNKKGNVKISKFAYWNFSSPEELEKEAERFLGLAYKI